ncbi:MAG: efflux RND transporter permease subunit [Acidobacteria bacterium]|nr:MAG: efflux RND transporter permease subunit [Acidobacteriota bacterium]
MNITRAAIYRPVTVSMFVVAFMLFGLVSLDRLSLNLLPDISYPSLTVQTDYEDAAPEEVESLITRPVEEAVGVVPGLTRLTSVSRSGQSEVILEFSWDTKMDFASLEVREKLDFVQLPRDAEKPVILRFDPSHDPILRMRLYGDLSLSQLRYAGDKDLRKELESTDGVAALKIIGGLEEEIQVQIDEKKLAELGIPITEVTQVLGQENQNQAAGSLYDLDANYLVRMLNQFESVDEIRDIIIRNQNGRRVVLGDVAKVWRGSKERDVIARINGKESVEIAIYKEGDANTVTVARAVESRLKALKAGNRFPKGVEYEVVFNQADFIENAVDDVLSSAMIGGLLATIILFLFLRDLRSTISIGLAIPVSIMVTFALMYQTDISLNIMSLGGVALGVGMLVDNSIVVLESIHRHRKPGVPLVEAVSKGANEVGMAVTASTLTTVAVFVPLIFVEGIAGQLFKDQALTITYSLLASLLVALTFLPVVLGMHLKKASEQPAVSTVRGERQYSQRKPIRAIQKVAFPVAGFLRRSFRFVFSSVATTVVADIRRLVRALGRVTLIVINPALNLFSSGIDRLTIYYPRLLNWSLDNKPVVVAVTLAMVVAAAALSLRLGAELIPSLTQGEFTFEIKLPEGKALPQTDRTVQAVEKRVATYPEIKTVFSSVGGSTKNQFATNSFEENYGQLYVVMKDRTDKVAEERVINRTRDEIASFPEVTYTFSRPTLFSFKTPVEVEVYSFDLEDMRQAAERIAAGMAGIPGLKDIQTTTQLGNPEIHVVFDRDRLTRMGLDETQISNGLRNKIRGDVATRYREEDRQIDILVRTDESDRKTVESIENMVVNVATLPGTTTAQPAAGDQQAQERTPANRQQVAPSIPIRLASVADVRLERGPSEIRRIRSQRAAVVSANLTGHDLNSVAEEVKALLRDLRGELPANTTANIAGQNEELSTAYNSLIFALGLAIFLVYLVMASQFESLLHPFVILFTVPLALVGVVFSLWITGTTVNVMVFLGVIILAGIVVNNAIVLIDYTNQLRQQGYSKRRALLEAGEVRLRPILMTTLTTVLGLIPMALSWGEGAEVRAPMAITVMGGLSFSTLLTLVLIPVVYEYLDRKEYAVETAEAPSGEGLQPAAGK